MIKKCSLGLVLLLCACVLWAKDIIIYHTTDMHGQYFGTTDKAGNPVGGFARLSNVLKNAPKPFLLLDSGDFSSGSHEANISNGKYSIDLMNRMKYTALTIGNHDSDFGDKGLGKMLSRFKGDVLAMNVANLPMTGKSVKPHALYNVKGIKVGVIGVAMDGSGSEQMGIRNTPSTEEFEAQIQALKQKGAEVIVVLTHDSLITDGTVSVDKRSNILGTLEKAPSFSQIDLLLGGHAHTQTAPTRLAGADGKGPWALEDDAYLKSISATVVHKDDKTGQITVNQPYFIKLDGAEDPAVKRYLNSIRVKSLDENIYAVVPTLITKYPSAEQADRAPGVARLFAEQMYNAIKDQEPLDLAAFSLNSTRSDYKPGEMSGRYFAEMTPYKEHAGTFDITGEHLLRAMNESLGFRNGRCFSVYGYSPNVRATILCDKQAQKATLQKATINGVKIDPAKTYRMAMLTHLPQGYYEGKPFKVVDPSDPQKNVIIKHYYQLTNSDMLFNVIEEFRKQQGVKIPLFIAPSDVQIKENRR